MASGSFKGLVKVWRWVEGGLEKQYSLRDHSNPFQNIVFSPKGRTLLTSSQDGRICIWDVETGEKRSDFSVAKRGEFFCALFSSDGTHVCVANQQNRIIRRFDFHGLPIPESQHSQASVANKIAVAERQSVAIFNSRDGKIKRLEASEHMVYKAMFSPTDEQEHLATLGGDGTIRFWDLASGDEIFVIRLPQRFFGNYEKSRPTRDFDFQFTPNGCWVAVPLAHGELLLYEMGDVYYPDEIKKKCGPQ